MLRIHQPYIKSNRLRKTFAFASIGVFLLAIGILIASPVVRPSSFVSAAEIKYMQQFTNPICKSMSTGETMDLIDPRGESEEDFQTYTIVKLKDNRCWMQQNLKLNATSDTGLALTSNDTNITGNWTLPKTLVGSGTSVSGWTNDNTNPYSATFNNATYGTYYNWCAATAGTCAGATSGGQVASGSICPKGWHLPSGNANGEFYTLMNGLNMSTITASPYLFPAAGYVDSGTLNYASSRGYYWSRTANSDTSAYYLYFLSSNLFPGTNVNYRYNGFSVRCVADPTVTESDFTYGDIEWSEDKTGDVTVNVPSILTIDAASGLTETADASKIIEGAATATISSNTEYNVTLHSTQPSLKDSAVTTAEISPVSSSNPVQPGNNSWGFWDGTGSSDSKSYTLPITATTQSFPNTATSTTNTSGDPATLHTYYVGISISPSLPSGTYVTDVIITASVK